MGHYADYTSSLKFCQPAKCFSPSGDACGHPQAFKSPAVSLIRGGRGNIATIAGSTPARLKATSPASPRLGRRQPYSATTGQAGTDAAGKSHRINRPTPGLIKEHQVTPSEEILAQLAKTAEDLQTIEDMLVLLLALEVANGHMSPQEVYSLCTIQMAARIAAKAKSIMALRPTAAGALA